MRILIDAMGGDHAPQEIVKGALASLESAGTFELELIGDLARIEPLVSAEARRNPRLFLTHATEIVTNHDKPTEAIRNKKDSSLVQGLLKIRDKQGHALISAGSTGALAAGSLMIPGRIQGVLRPALAPIVPSECGGTMIVDAGMNLQCRPENLLQFGIMGAMWMQGMQGVANPRVGLINVGTEESKGLALTKEAFELLQKSGLNFVGNIEGRDIAGGAVDVAVCDGFTGNAMLKMMEGTGRYFSNHLKAMFGRNLLTRLAALMMLGEIRRFRKSIDPEEIGGTPILGIDGMIWKCHGNSTAKAITNTILKSSTSAAEAMTDRFGEAFKTVETGGDE